MPEPIGFINLDEHHCESCPTTNNCPLKSIVKDMKPLNTVIGEYFLSSHEDLGTCVSSVVNTNPILVVFGIGDISTISMVSYLYGFRDGYRSRQEMEKLESISK